jgi:two-component system sensor kinase FixL
MAKAKTSRKSDDRDALLARIRELESQLESARLSATDHFHAAVEFAPNGIIMTDGDGLIHFANQRARDIFGYTADEIIWMPIERLMPERFRGGHVGMRERYHDAPEPRPMGMGRELFGVRKNGAEFPVEIGLTPLMISGELHILGMISDITERKRAEAAVKQLEDEIVQISEKEQRRIGQDLHDDLCQQLAGIGCLAKVLQQELEAGGDSNKAADLGRVVEMISQANTRAREISRGLTPAYIQREGLPSALEELASRTRRIFGVPCAFHCPDPVFVEDEKRAVQLYRVAQEAASNAVKHSDATRIDIHLDLLPGELRLRVIDDGRGLPPQAAAGLSSGLGLLTMAHRAKMLGGRLDAKSAPGGGTAITCTAPHQNE